MPHLVKSLLCKQEDLSSIPRTVLKTLGMAFVCDPSTGEKTPGRLLEPISQSSLISKYQVNERLCLKKEGRQLLRKITQGCALVSTYMYIHRHVHLPTFLHPVECMDILKENGKPSRGNMYL